MWRSEADEHVYLNWIAILSYSGSLVVSLGIWIGLFRMFHHFVR